MQSASHRMQCVISRLAPAETLPAGNSTDYGPILGLYAQPRADCESALPDKIVQGDRLLKLLLTNTAAAALAALPFVSTPLAAQTKAKASSKAESKPTPRTADGKPDLSGFWQGPLMRTMFESVGGPPFTAAGKAA